VNEVLAKSLYVMARVGFEPATLWMTRERTGHPPSYAEVQKMKLLAL